MKPSAPSTLEREGVLPSPLTPQQSQAGASAPYARREVWTRIIPARESARWCFDLAEAGGEGIMAALVQDNPGVAIQGLLKLGGAAAEDLIDRLLKYTIVTYNGERLSLSNKDNFDQAFTGELMLLVDVLIWVARQNFESFWRGRATAAAKPQTSQAATTTSPRA